MNLPKVVTQQRRGRASNPRLLDRKSDALPLQCAGQKGVNSLTAALRISTNSNCELQTIQIQKKITERLEIH